MSKKILYAELILCDAPTNGTSKENQLGLVKKDGKAVDIKIGDGQTDWADLEPIGYSRVTQYQIQTTYENLVHMRNAKLLIPGLYYRITNYKCIMDPQQYDTADKKFDIIVQALSEGTLSENAHADYHQISTPSGVTIKADFIEEEGILKSESIVPIYYQYIDYAGGGIEGAHEYKTSDIFIAYKYDENNYGTEVPILYKTDIQGIEGEEPDEELSSPDYADAFYYIGREAIGSVVYDKWRKIYEGDNSVDNDLTWNSTGKIYLYTNIITDIPDYDSSIDNATFSTWEIKYSLDNDTRRFSWANDTGRGVIYYMKDEYGNECPYDFKNIKLKDDFGTSHYTFESRDTQEDLTTMGHTHNCIIKSSFSEIQMIMPEIWISARSLNNVLVEGNSGQLYIQCEGDDSNILIYSGIHGKTIQAQSNTAYKPEGYTEVVISAIDE